MNNNQSIQDEAVQAAQNLQKSRAEFWSYPLKFKMFLPKLHAQLNGKTH